MVLLIPQDRVNFNPSILRMVRLLRPSRLLVKGKGQNGIIRTITDSLGVLFKFGTLILMYLVVFSIIGVQLYSGRLNNRCFAAPGGAGPPVDAARVCSPGAAGYKCPDGQTCRPFTPGNSRIAYPYTPGLFDNVLVGTVTIFQITSGVGWVDAMYILMDATGSSAVLFVVATILVGAFFLLNLVTAVLVDAYQAKLEGTEEADEEAEADKKLKEEKDVELKAVSQTKKEKEEAPLAPPKEESSFDKAIKSRAFEYAMYVIILANGLVQSFAPALVAVTGVNRIALYIHYGVSAVFVVEAGLHLAAYGLKEYIKKREHLFNLVVLAWTVVEAALYWTGVWPFMTMGSVIRLLSLLKLIALLRTTIDYEGVDESEFKLDLMAPVLAAVAPLLRIVVMLFILILLFAVLGMGLFRDHPAFDGERSNFNTVRILPDPVVLACD